MTKKNLLTIVGARPQLVKSAMISRLIDDKHTLREVYVHTGQHYDFNMSDIFFSEMKLRKPDYHLGIGSGQHAEQTGKMLIELEKVMEKEKPDCVLVYGDTNSTLAGALAAAKLHIPVAHVEAGLRSFNRKMPEEINRVMTDHLSEFLFAPTELSIKNLAHEGIAENKIHQVGDVMYDMVNFFGEIAGQHATQLNTLALNPKKFVLATIHRAENTNDENRLHAIIEGLSLVAEKIFPVILPLHPRTKSYLAKMKLLEKVQKSLILIEPLGLLDMLHLEKNAALIVTDSGGVQKEAYFAGVPCVTLRDETEWMELLDLGWNRLVTPLTSSRIFQEVSDAMNGTLAAENNQQYPYGRGNAADLIVAHLTKTL